MGLGTKKLMLLALILIACSVICIETSEDADADSKITGACGDNLSFEIDLDSKKLTISGSGDMYDYGEYEKKAPWANYYADINSLIIGDQVSSIGDNAFSYLYWVEGPLTIPSGVTSIGENAFCYCYSFTGSLTIPSGVTSIGDYAFYECSGFNGTLSLSSGLKTIGAYAFYECNNLTGSLTIPSGVTFIGEKAFYGCSGFNGTLSLSSGLKTIEVYAFYKCNNLTGSLTIPSGVTTIGVSAFEGCSGFNGTLTIPSGVTTIGDGAFSACSGFTGSLTIPSGVKTIEQYAFLGCSGFNGTLTIPSSVTTIGDGAFSACSGFTGSLTIPSGVTTIGEKTFYGCSGFKGTLTLPSGVKAIEREAFCDCSGFKGTLTMPSSVTTIGISAFEGCSGFTGSLTIPSGVENIKDYAFYKCTGFNGTLTMPSSLCNIGDYAFYECKNLTGSLTIPSGVINIGENAFDKCSGFDGTLAILSGAALIELYAFRDCSGFTELAIKSGAKVESGAFNGWAFFDGKTGMDVRKIPGYKYQGTVTGMVKQGPVYAVSFNVTGGSISAPNGELPMEGDTFVFPSYSGAKTKSVFGGWTDGSNIYSPGETCTMGRTNMTFTAVWVPIYTISFNVDGGSSRMYDVTLLEGVAFTMPSYQGIKEGYVFVGWSDGFSTYMPGYKIVNIRSDLHLKAVWIEAPHTVYYDLAGGSGYVPSQTLKEGAEFTLASYDGTKTGFIFKGWSDGTESYAPGHLYTMGSEDITFKAVWEKPPHTVSYDLAGGSGSVPSVTVAEDGQFALASYSGVKAGFTFGGWSDGKGTYLPGDLYTMGVSDIVFKAVWNANAEYAVSYDLAGGSGSVPSVKCREGSVISTSQYDGTKAGFTFGGWQYDGTYYSVGSSFTMPSRNVMFTAVWNDNDTHVVSYDLAGGSGSVSGCTVKEGVGFETAGYTGTKAGFTFGGWQLGETVYAPGTSIVMGTTDMVFTAVWGEKTIHVVSYDLAGGSGSIGSQYVAEGEKFVLQMYYGTKTGYSFAGWQCIGASYQPGAEVTMGQSDMMFIAVWTKIVSHHVYYDLAGGSGSIATQTVEEGKAFTIVSEKPVKDGSSFVGWSSAGSTYGPGDTATMGKSDMTFKAVWESDSDASQINMYIIVAVLAAILVIAAALVIVRRKP